MKCGEVYVRLTKWYFYPSSRCITGLWVATPPILKLASLASYREKGEAAMRVLQESQDNVPLPDSPSAFMRALLEISNSKSWAVFANRAQFLSIQLDGSTLTILPSRKLGSGGAFEGVPESAITLEQSATQDEVGHALEVARLSCE